jgi:4-amino-4-deoxy-L-arabinose transferase-like glycosyltransferase
MSNVVQWGGRPRPQPDPLVGFPQARPESDVGQPKPDEGVRRSPGGLPHRASASLQRAAPLAVFIATLSLLLWLFGNRLILGTNDEGIYLDAAERILHGQKLYVDFFGYMSPGSFWMQALAFRVLGITLAAGRALPILYVALECGLIYWLVERFASRTAAIVTALFFLAFQTADPSMLTAQHRWDSSAFALASIALCVGARRYGLIASGFLIACAALATPSVALVAIVTLVWLRKRAGWYLLGIAVAGTAAVIAIWLNGILPALIQQLGWLSRNYASVNVMPYGAIIGGYWGLFQGATVWELPIRLCVVVCMALPALLPILAVVLVWTQRKTELLYLLLCVIALVASTYPRSDVAHLAYVAALSYALVGILVHRLLPSRPRAWLTASIAIWAAVFAWQIQLPGNLRPLSTPAGDVRASAAEAPVVEQLLSRVRPRQTLFVYPYKPLLYFLTQADNPTRYSYLAPGMMTGADASVVLSELEARPPDWVLYMDLDRTEFERVFPAAKGLDAHYPQLEHWIQANYRNTGGQPLGGYVLLRRALAE